MIENESIRAVKVNGEVVVSEASIRGLTPKEQLPEYKMYARLKGVPIWISDAARRYDIPQVTVSRWVQKGLIKIIGEDKNKILLDEQDIAYCAEIHHKRGGQGKRLFKPDGTLYIPRTERAQATA